MAEQGQRVPPHSIEAEQSVLGSMLLDGNAVISAMETIKAQDFYIAANRTIYEAMESLYAENLPVDMVTVVDRLEQRGTLERAGGMEYLATLSRAVPTTANVGQYIAIVEDRSVLRGVIDAGSHMVASGFAADRPAEEVVNEAHDAVYALAVRKRADSLKPISGALVQAFKSVNDAMTSQGGLTGIPSGFADLDRLTSGFEPGQLIILAARPGMGKTSFALNLAHNVAQKTDLAVAVFSLEMSEKDLALRMLCADAEVSLQDVRSGNLREQDFAKLLESMRKLNNTGIYIDDSGSASVPEIRARCMRLSAQKKLGLVVIDYLQLMTSTTRADNRQQEVSALTRGLKLLARDIEAPIVLLSQLNRAVETRAVKRPMLADLRESGSIEQDADIVIMLAHNRDLKRSDSDLDDDEDDLPENAAFAIVAKNRNGPTDDVPLLWLAEYTKFVSFSSREE